jgi:hypothetical protein
MVKLAAITLVALAVALVLISLEIGPETRVSEDEFRRESGAMIRSIHRLAEAGRLSEREIARAVQDVAPRVPGIISTSARHES